MIRRLIADGETEAHRYSLLALFATWTGLRLVFLFKPIMQDEAANYMYFAAKPLWFGLSHYPDASNRSAAVTHNHPEGIKGAQATAAATFMARKGESKERIKRYIEDNFSYDLDEPLDDIRRHHEFNKTCQSTVPQAVRAFLELTDFEDAVRNAVSIGGDSDTLAR
jgi:ADP-ribosylglycohydrolase